MEENLLNELSELLSKAVLVDGNKQDEERPQNPVNCSSILGKRKHPEDSVDLSQSPHTKKIKITHTEQVNNEGRVNTLPRSRSAGF